ncbi:hypothetical protein BH11BAC2_BH11BAC2_10770 [soil metagenome]
MKIPTVKSGSFSSFVVVWLICTVFIILMIPSRSFDGDMRWWKEWASYILYHPIGEAYNNPLINYQPGFVYLLKLYGNLCQGHFSNNSILIKQLIFIFDGLAVLLAGYLLHKINRSPFLALIILFNPAYWYTTILWGQCDSMYVFFCLLSVVALIMNYRIFAVSAFALSLCVKPQAVFIAPVLFMLMLPEFWKKPLRILRYALVFIATVFLVSLPFVLRGNGRRLLDLTFTAVDRLPSISMHAFNSWYLLIPGKDLVWAPDTQLFLGVSLKLIGLIMFIIAMSITLVPMGKQVRKGIDFGNTIKTEHVLLIYLTVALLNLDLFFFATQMHERYIHAAIIFSGIAAMISGRYVVFSLISLGYLLNLDFLIRNFQLPESVYRAPLPFNEIFIALLFLGALIIGHVEIYRSATFREEKEAKKNMLNPHFVK